eukprot:4089935-Ditylum_brightwellii.AAC.1
MHDAKVTGKVSCGNDMTASVGDRQAFVGKSTREVEMEEDERKRNQRRINNPPEVPISQPTHHNIEQDPEGVHLHQKGPISGSKGEGCPLTAHGRSTTGPKLYKSAKKLENEPTREPETTKESKNKPKEM